MNKEQVLQQYNALKDMENSLKELINCINDDLNFFKEESERKKLITRKKAIMNSKESEKDVNKEKQVEKYIDEHVRLSKAIIHKRYYEEILKIPVIETIMYKYGIDSANMIHIITEVEREGYISHPDYALHKYKFDRSKFNNICSIIKSILDDNGKTKSIFRGNTESMLEAYTSDKPLLLIKHNPELRNNDGETVAMILAKRNLNIPEVWRHKSDLQDLNGNTVAMNYAKQRPIPEEWYHSPGIQNFAGDTVAMLMGFRQTTSS